VCPDQAPEDLWTSRTLSTFHTFPRDVIHPSFAFMIGAGRSVYERENRSYLADGSGTARRDPDSVQVRLRTNKQIVSDLIQVLKSVV
jgi:hypothetical protein